MENIEKIMAIVKKELSSSSHDIEHTLRVRSTALKIARHTEHADTEIVELAAVLHDIARVKEDTDTTRIIDHAVLGAEIARGILKKFGYSKKVVEGVCHCIATHRYRGNNLPQTTEAKILSDADKLDAIGAIGVARAFMIAGEYGEPLFKEIDQDENNSINTKNGRIKNFGEHSPSIEYEVKLKRIPGRLYTDFAKEIAQNRIKFMDEFFSKLKKEVEGEE